MLIVGEFTCWIFYFYHIDGILRSGSSTPYPLGDSCAILEATKIVWFLSATDGIYLVCHYVPEVINKFMLG